MLGDYYVYFRFTVGNMEGSENGDMRASLLYHIAVTLQEGKEFHHKSSSLPSSRPESGGWRVMSLARMWLVALSSGGTVLREGLA